MSLYTLSFLCALAFFALQVPGNLGRNYVDIPGIGRVYLSGNTKVEKISNGGMKITRITGNFPGRWNPFQPVNPNNRPNPFQPVNPNNRPNPFQPVNPNNRPNPFKPVNPNNRPNPNSGPGSSRGSGGSPSSSSPGGSSDIVNKHNDLRRNVSPPASNMLKMSWSNKLAANAQRWADKCTQLHSSQKMPDGTSYGENLYMSSGRTNWDMAIQKWYDEVKYWKYGVGTTDSSQAVGHYTQVVWANSNKIGCAMATCPNSRMKYYFVCQYSPPGNYRNVLPYPYKKGRSCSGCRGSCENKLCRR